MSSFKFRSTDYVDTSSGEYLDTAADKINSFFGNLSADWIGFITPYVDANASQVINIPFSNCNSTVVDYLTGDSLFDVSQPENLLVEKYMDLPIDLQIPIYNHYFNPDKLAQKAGILDTTRALYYDYTTQQYEFANNTALYDTYSEFTGIVGNIYPHKLSFDLVINGLYYDFSTPDLVPGTVYYLTDSLDGWMIPYEEGGNSSSVSVPMSIAIHKNAAVLLTDRAVLKDLPCYVQYPPQQLRFMKAPIYTEYLDISDGDPYTDPSVRKYTAYTTIGEPYDPASDPWNNPNITKYSLYEEIT